MRNLSLVLILAALIPAAAWPADPKAARFYEDALGRYEKRDFPGAIIQLRNALQVDNAMLPGHLLLGKALLGNGEVAAAEVAFTEALRLGVNRAEIAVPLAQTLLAQGKHRQLFLQSELRLDGLPGDVRLRLLLLRASAHSDLGETREAQQSIEEAKDIEPRSPEPWLAEVPIRIRARQFAMAKTAIDKTLALAPESAEGWYQKGAVHHVSGEISQALAAYDRVLKIDAAHVEARIARAGLHVDLGRNAAAVADIAELGRHAPQEPRGAYLRALLAEREGKAEDARNALRDLTRLIDPVPLDFIRYRPQLLMLNGLAHFGLGEIEKAKSYLEIFHRGQGNTPASKLLAQIYLGEARTDRAIEVLEAYLKAQPADGQAMILLGTALQAKGQHARAVAWMKRALETRDAPEFRTVLGLSLIRGGEAASAIPELEAALKLNPGQAQAASALVGLYLNSGQGAKAVKLAEDMVKRRPASADFHNLLGIAKRQAGNRTAARAAFEQAVKLDSKLPAPQINLARFDIADQAYDAAAARLDAVLRAAPRNIEAIFEMAVLEERRGRLPEAQRWLEKAVDVGSLGAVRWPLALADFHLRHGKLKEAHEAVKTAVARGPEDMSALLALARMELARKDAAAARATLSTATRAAQFDSAAQVQVALLQLAAGNPDGAAYSLEKALSGKPDYLPAQALMAEVELKQGEAGRAEKRARELLSKHSGKAIGHSLLGDIAAARGQSAEALEAYRRAHQVEPSTDTLLRLFRALAVKDTQAAIQLAGQWLKSHPKDVAVMRALGDGQARSGNYAAARKAYEALLKLSSGDPVVYNNLANVLHRLKDPGAVAMAEQAVARSPGNPVAIDTLGWILLQQGRTDEALLLLRDARLRAPENPEIRYHLALALEKSGRRKEAREELAEALRSGVPFEGIEEAKQLERLLGK
jgi:putative PEP-CTERM system TPR-repeat lipoprotein